MKGRDNGGIGEPLDRPGELHFKFITRFDSETPLSELYENVLVKLVAKHQTELVLAVANPVNWSKQSLSADESLRKDFIKELTKEGVYRLLLVPVFKRDDAEHDQVRMRIWTTQIKDDSLDVFSLVLSYCRLIYQD